MKYVKSVGIPVMLYILVETTEENDELVIASGKEMFIDILEENWEDQFEYGSGVLEFEAMDFLPGSYAHTLDGTEEDDEVTEATEDGVGTEGGGLRNPVGDVQSARERDEGLPL